MTKANKPDFLNLIGLSVNEADEALKTAGYKMRVVQEDGEHFIVTMDYRLDRVNVAVNNGKVSSINGVG